MKAIEQFCHTDFYAVRDFEIEFDLSLSFSGCSRWHIRRNLHQIQGGYTSAIGASHLDSFQRKTMNNTNYTHCSESAEHPPVMRITCPVFPWLLDDDYSLVARLLLHCFSLSKGRIILAAQDAKWLCSFKDNFFSSNVLNSLRSYRFDYIGCVLRESRRRWLFYFVVVLCP